MTVRVAAEPSRRRIWHAALPMGLGLALFLGCGQSSTQKAQPPGHEIAKSRATVLAEEILAAAPEDGDLYDKATLARMQSATDKLVALGEEAAPGLDRLLHGMLDRPLDRKRAEADSSILFSILGRFTFPHSLWKPASSSRGEFFLKPGTYGDEAKAVRHPWLRPFILKALTHGFLRPRYESSVLWSLWYHSASPAADLVAMSKAAPRPRVRAWSLELLSRVSPLPRAQLADALVWCMDSDSNCRPLTMAIALSIKFNVQSALRSLVDLAHRTDQVDCLVVQDFVAKRFLGSPPKEPPWGFEPRIGELAVFAYQEISGEDLGFTNCYDSRARMPEIIKRLQTEPKWESGRLPPHKL